MTNSTRDYLSVASPTSMRPAVPQSSGTSCCSSETDHWRVFVKICDLSRDDIKALHGMEYTSMTRLSMLGLTKNTNQLVQAGISEAKATMMLFFATYIVHCKYHQINIPKDLTFDHVLEFNFLMANPNEYNMYHQPTLAAVPSPPPPSALAIPAATTTNHRTATTTTTSPAVDINAAIAASQAELRLPPPATTTGTTQEPLESISSNHSIASSAASSKGSSRSSSSRGRSKRHHQRKKRLSDPESYTKGEAQSFHSNSNSNSNKPHTTTRGSSKASAAATSADESSVASKSSMRSARSAGSSSKKNVSWKPQIAKFSNIPPLIAEEESYDSLPRTIATINDRWGATARKGACSSSDDENGMIALSSGSGGGWSSSDEEQRFSIASCPVKFMGSGGTTTKQRSSTMSHDTKSTAATTSTMSSTASSNRWSSSNHDIMDTSTRSMPLQESSRGGMIGHSRSSDSLLSCPNRRDSIDDSIKTMESKLNKVFANKRHGITKRTKCLQAVDEHSSNSSRNMKQRPPPPTRGTSPANIPLMLSFLESKNAAAPPPRCAAARSSMRWAQALDVEDEDLTDDEDWDVSDSDSDSESDSDSDSESDSDDDSDSSDEDDESSEDDDDYDYEEEEPLPPKKTNKRESASKKDRANANSDTVTWKTHNVTIEEWTMPANQVLPVNLQGLFRQAAMNPEIDIQKQIHEALAKSMAPPPSTATQCHSNKKDPQAGRSPTRKGSGTPVVRSPSRQGKNLSATTRAA